MITFLFLGSVKNTERPFDMNGRDYALRPNLHRRPNLRRRPYANLSQNGSLSNMNHFIEAFKSKHRSQPNMNASFTGLAEVGFQNDFQASAVIVSRALFNPNSFEIPFKLIVKKKAEEAGLRKRDEEKKVEQVSEKSWKRKGFIRQSSETVTRTCDVKPNVTYR